MTLVPSPGTIDRGGVKNGFSPPPPPPLLLPRSDSHPQPCPLLPTPLLFLSLALRFWLRTLLSLVLFLVSLRCKESGEKRPFCRHLFPPTKGATRGGMRQQQRNMRIRPGRAYRTSFSFPFSSELKKRDPVASVCLIPRSSTFVTHHLGWRWSPCERLPSQKELVKKETSPDRIVDIIPVGCTGNDGGEKKTGASPVGIKTISCNQSRFGKFRFFYFPCCTYGRALYVTKSRLAFAAVCFSNIHSLSPPCKWYRFLITGIPVTIRTFPLEKGSRLPEGQKRDRWKKKENLALILKRHRTFRS